MNKICVFCGANVGADPRYLEAAEAFGKLLVKENIELVYGGGRVGMMGKIADVVMENGGKVTGVIPTFLRRKEVAHEGITKMFEVETMHERKMKMADLSDGFVALPGGIGTLEELCEVFTWSQLGLHRKPIGILNVIGYYDSLLRFFEDAVDQKFLHATNKELILTSHDGKQLLEKMRGFAPPDSEKWLDRSLV